jgi:hypothetical protein
MPAFVARVRAFAKRSTESIRESRAQLVEGLRNLNPPRH